jgi:hypothetical protein
MFQLIPIVFYNIHHYANSSGGYEPFGYGLINALYKEGAIVVNKLVPAPSHSTPNPAPPPPDFCVPENLEVHNNTFSDCRMGIYAFGCPVVVQNNTFGNTKYNAFKGSSLASAIISGNMHTYNAVQLMHPWYNHFNYEYYIGQPQKSVVGYNINISENTIYTYKSGMNLTNATSSGSIHINPQRLVHLQDNYIYLDDLNTNPRQQGIRLQACDRSKVFGNTIENMDPAVYPTVQLPLDNLHGIQVNQTVDALVYDNYSIKRFGRGVYNIGYNAGTQFWCNQFIENFDGFYCEAPGMSSNTVVSPQLISKVANNNCFVDNVQYRINYLSSILPLEWYYVGQLDPSNCTAPVNSHKEQALLGTSMDPPCAPFPANWGDEITRESLYGAIAREEDTLYASLPDEFEWYADEYLYRALNWDSAWMYMGVSEDSIYQLFYGYFSNPAIIAFAEIEELIGMGDLEQALWNNNNVVTQTLIEFNQQLVNEIYLETWAQEIGIDSVQASMLESIALLTPYVGGNAVFTARVMLDLDPFNHGLPYRMAKDSTLIPSLKVAFYPNPANGLLTMEFLDAFPKTDGQFEIFDLQGRKVLEKCVDNTRFRFHFDTSNLKDGIYLARIQLDNGQHFTQKVLIKH